MAIFDDTVPSNSEGVKLGAQRIREGRTILNTLLGYFFSDAAGTRNVKTVDSAMLANDAAVDANRAVGTNHLKDASVTAAKLASGAALPVGSLLPFAGAAAPSGFALCAGQSVLRADTTYAALFAVIGTTYGTADGTHFNLPDLRGRAPWGLDNMTGSAASRLTTGTGAGTTLGAGDGEQQHTLTTPEIPAHTHTVPYQFQLFNTGSGAGGHTMEGGTTNTGSTGGGTAHNNMPPYLMVNYLIKL